MATRKRKPRDTSGLLIRDLSSINRYEPARLATLQYARWRLGAVLGISGREAERLEALFLARFEESATRRVPEAEADLRACARGARRAASRMGAGGAGAGGGGDGPRKCARVKPCRLRSLAQRGAGRTYFTASRLLWHVSTGEWM